MPFFLTFALFPFGGGFNKSATQLLSGAIFTGNKDSIALKWIFLAAMNALDKLGLQWDAGCKVLYREIIYKLLKGNGRMLLGIIN
jgi:hypothetical protein